MTHICNPKRKRLEDGHKLLASPAFIGSTCFLKSVPPPKFFFSKRKKKGKEERVRGERETIRREDGAASFLLV